MRHLVHAFLRDKLNHCDDIEDATDRLLSFIESPEFVELYVQRIKCPVDIGLGANVNLKWSIAMTALTDAAAAFVASLQATIASNKVDPTHLATLDSEVAALQTNDATDEANIADLTNAVSIITAGLNPAPSPSPAPAPTPSPAP